ncbi:hypothetical protein [Actinomadura keratinilytica]|jgi:hypothetical protein|uniref:MarR family transcriptional regulator n=1 Tax=Actinomadura keratinilytica TaxID=547461 RepID=A0ABP7YSC0_9ACTN
MQSADRRALARAFDVYHATLVAWLTCEYPTLRDMSDISGLTHAEWKPSPGGVAS